MKLWVKIVLWTLFAVGVIVLLNLSNSKREDELLPEPTISINVEGENAFINKDELLGKLRRNQLLYPNQLRKDLKILEVESFIKSISQVKSVDVYAKLDGNWNIDLELRKPIVRVFNKYGESFYLDDTGAIMHTTPTFTARVIVASGEISTRITGENARQIINNDSLISIRNLDDIYWISNYVCNDPLFHSLIGQIFVEKDGTLTLTPIVGDQKIVFGSANSEDEVKDKFDKLRIFYKEAMPYEGWNTYSVISIMYDGQIVCKKKKTNE